MLGVVFPCDGSLTCRINRSSSGDDEDLTALESASTFSVVNDGGFFGRQHFHMGNVGLWG